MSNFSNTLIALCKLIQLPSSSLKSWLLEAPEVKEMLVGKSVGHILTFDLNIYPAGVLNTITLLPECFNFQRSLV